MQIYHLEGAIRTYLARGAAERELPVFRSFVGEIAVDVIQNCQAPHVDTNPLGNIQHVPEFTVEKEHATQEAANRFFFMHTKEVLGLHGTFVFVSEDGFNEADFYLKNATLQRVSFPEPDGVTTEATYRIVGGEIANTP